MNQVVGRVLLKDKGTGIPNLVVTAYHVHQDSIPNGEQATLLHSWDQLEGDRLGSILTDTDGAFALDYDASTLSEDRPSLLLFVTAPEGAGADRSSPMLHVSCGIRQNAGRVESYLISLTADDLRSAGVSPPAAPAPAAPVPRRLADRAARMNDIRAAMARVRTTWQHADGAVPRVADVYREKLLAARPAAGDGGIPANGFRLAVPQFRPDGPGPVRLRLREEAPGDGFSETVRERLVRARQESAS